MNTSGGGLKLPHRIRIVLADTPGAVEVWNFPHRKTLGLVKSKAGRGLPELQLNHQAAG